MNSNYEWAQYFHVPQEAIELWKNEAAETKSLLYWCMEKGAIEPHEYLNWARDTYCLPSVGTHFFNLNSNTQFWSQVKDKAAWSEELAPISEWDGVVYVGCLQPPQNVSFDFPVQFVLVHVMDLKNHWKILNPTPVKNISSDVHTTVLKANEWENKLNDWANTQSHTNINESSVEPTTDANSEAVTEATVVPVIETAAAFAPAIETPKIEVSMAVNPTQMPMAPTESADAFAANSTEIPMDQPDGLNFNLNQGTPSAKVYDPLDELRKSLGVNDDSAPLTNKSSEPVSLDAPEGMNFSVKKDNQEAPPDLMPDGLNLNIKPVATIPVVKITDAVTSAPVIPTTIPTPSTVINTPASSLNIKESPSAPSLTLDNSQATNTGTYTGFLAEFYTHFQAGMVIDVENETFIPLMWNEGFKRSNEDSVKRYSLNEASCFRIAYRTQMPYIGYVVSTQQNKDFFNAFGFDELPKTILVQPVLVNKKVISLLLATFDSSKKTHHIVAAGEELARKFIENKNSFGKKAA